MENPFKMVIFPAGTAAIIGGACSLIGSTSQLAANSVLQGYAGYEEGMGMFDMTKIMFPAAVVQIIFWGTIGYKLLDKVLNRIVLTSTREICIQLQRYISSRKNRSQLLRHGRAMWHSEP